MLKLSKTATDILKRIKELEENKDRYIIIENNYNCTDCYFFDKDFCELIDCKKGVYRKIEAITREEAIKVMVEGKKVRPLRYKECRGYACYDPNYSIPFRWVEHESSLSLKGVWHHKEWVIID